MIKCPNPQCDSDVDVVYVHATVWVKVKADEDGEIQSEQDQGGFAEYTPLSRARCAKCGWEDDFREFDTCLQKNTN